MEEPGRLQPMGSQRIRRNLATEQVIFIDIYMTWLSVHVYVHLCLCMSNMYVQRNIWGTFKGEGEV